MKNKNSGWQRVLIIIIPSFILVEVFQLIGALISGVSITDLETGKIEETSFQFMIMQLFSLLGTFLLIWIFMKIFDKEKFSELGFKIKNRANDVGIGFLLGAIIMTMSYFLLLSIDEIQYSKIIFDSKEIMFTILTFILVAFIEETLFRGYILKNLMLSFNKYIALFVSSILFALLHAVNPNIDTFALITLFLAGLLLGISYLYTKNLWFPIALHFSWNLFQTLIGFNVSGKDAYSFVEFSMLDKNMLNGGDFGFEGSILAGIVIILLTLAIDLFYRKKLTQITKKNSHANADF